MGLMSHSTGTGTPLLCGYAVNSFFSNFTPYVKKSYSNAVMWQTRKFIFMFSVLYD